MLGNLSRRSMLNVSMRIHSLLEKVMPGAGADPDDHPWFADTGGRDVTIGKNRKKKLYLDPEETTANRAHQYPYPLGKTIAYVPAAEEMLTR